MSYDWDGNRTRLFKNIRIGTGLILLIGCLSAPVALVLVS